MMKDLCHSLMDAVVAHFIENVTINAILFYPQSKKSQADYIYRVLPEYVAQLHAKDVSKGLDSKFSSEMLSYLQSKVINTIGNIHDFCMAISKPHKEYFRQTFIDMFLKGYSAGAILAISISDKVSKTEAIRRYIDDLQSGCGKYTGPYMMPGVGVKITESNFMNNIWSAYKNVAHYWAALVRGDVIQDDESACFINFSKFHCDSGGIHASGIQAFLKLGEKYRQLGISFVPKQSNTPLLDPSTAVRIFPIELKRSNS